MSILSAKSSVFFEHRRSEFTYRMHSPWEHQWPERWVGAWKSGDALSGLGYPA